MEENKLTVEESFNLLVQLARAQKLTWNEHQRVSVAISVVLEALNQDNHIHETRELDSSSDKKS